jgi:hypothetical protein
MLFNNMTKKFLKKQYAYRSYIMTGLILSIINTSAQELVTKELIINGDFEQGNWDNWDKYTRAEFVSGFFLSRPGTEPPVSQKYNGNRLTANNATGGNYYMVTDQLSAGINVLLQTFTIPEGTTKVTLQFQMFVNSYHCKGEIPASLCKTPTAIINRCGLSLSCGDNQHARVDILRANTTPFSTSTTLVLRNLYIGIDYGSNPHNYTTYSFDITDTVITPGDYILRFAEVDNRNFLNMGIDNISIQATVAEKPEDDPVNNPTPAGCQLYGVQDNGLNNSEFFTLQPTGETNTFGKQHGYDIESLAIHPVQHWLYGVSSSDVDADKDKGYLYRIDAVTGELYPVGDIKNEIMDFDDVDSLAFNHADNTFWGWAKGYGLIKINPLTAYATLEIESREPIEGLAWDINGDLLYGAQETTLWVYNKNNNVIFEHHCILPAGKVEGLEMIQHFSFNGGVPFLVMGLHNLIGINLVTCDLVIDKPTSYNDIEGLAFEPTTCGDIELPLSKPIASIHYQPYQ